MTGPLEWRRSLAVGVLGWVWARVCVGAGFWVAHLVTPDPALAGRQDFPLPKGLKLEGAAEVNLEHLR